MQKKNGRTVLFKRNLKKNESSKSVRLKKHTYKYSGIDKLLLFEVG